MPRGDGDPVYCGGIRIGTFHGKNLPGGWYIDLVPSRELPAVARVRLAEHAAK